MRKILVLTALVSLVVCLTSSAALAKNHKLKLHTDVLVAGKKIDSGSYLVKIDEEGHLSILKSGKILAEADVKIEPLGSGTPESVSLDRSGNLREIRFKDQKVVFPMLSNAGQTGE